MLYTVAEAAKATGFEESTFLRAIDDGQISGTQDQSGEWQVEEDEIHRLYLLVAQQKVPSRATNCGRNGFRR